jgi:chromosome segregation ATPase
MDLTQAMQQINWLESERRKDKAALTTLQEKVAGATTELAEQSKRIQELQNALTATRLALGKIGQFDKLFEQFKVDLVAEMDRREEAQQKALREAERLRKVEAEAIGRSITEVRKELPRIKPLEDEMPMRRAEEHRLGEVLTRLNQRVDELAVRTEDRVQNMIYLEANRQQDAKRIAQLEEDDTSLAKRLDALVGKLTLLDDNVQRLPQRLDQFDKRMQDQDKVFEELRRRDFERTQEMKVFTEEVTKVVTPIPEYLTRFQADSQRMQELAIVTQRAVEEIKGFQMRIETRQAELAQMQRINEERIKKQVEEWQGEQEKRWKRETLVWTEQWQEHDRLHAPWETRLEAVEHQLLDFHRQFKALWDGVEEMPKVYLSAIRQVVEAQNAWLEKGHPSRPIVGNSNRAASDKS